jgi:hypothetical protein
MKNKTYDIENAPTEPLTRPLTEPLIGREHHRIATLGRNPIVTDRYRTSLLPYLAAPRPEWRDAVAEITRGLRRLIGAALQQV